MITMLDVVRKAGVSKATVSRVLAGNRYVSKSTQQKVFQAIEETGYRPNLLERSLAAISRRSPTISCRTKRRAYCLGAWTLESGQAAARQLLNAGVPFSVLMASNDDMAIGVALALSAAGKRLPQDVSLMGFDDICMAEFFLPPLTTAHVPVAEMIQHTLAQLVAMLEGEAIAPAATGSGDG